MIFKSQASTLIFADATVIYNLSNHNLSNHNLSNHISASPNRFSKRSRSTTPMGCQVEPESQFLKMLNHVNIQF